MSSRGIELIREMREVNNAERQEQVRREAERRWRKINSGPHWMRILHEVAEKHRIGVKSLLSASKARNVVTARNEAFYRMRHEIVIAGEPMSFPLIASKFGKDHTTVIWGVRRHESRLGAAR